MNIRIPQFPLYIPKSCRTNAETYANVSGKLEKMTGDIFACKRILFSGLRYVKERNEDIPAVKSDHENAIIGGGPDDARNTGIRNADHTGQTGKRYDSFGNVRENRWRIRT